MQTSKCKIRYQGKGVHERSIYRDLQYRLPLRDSMELIPSWEVNSGPTVSQSRNYAHFIEPVVSLPCSQSPATGSYSERVPSYPISLISILILSSHQRLCLTIGLFSSELQTNFLRISCIPHARYMLRLSHYLRFDHCNNIIMKLFIMQLSPVPCHFTPRSTLFSNTLNLSSCIDARE
jgi:hypothetical protein